MAEAKKEQGDATFIIGADLGAVNLEPDSKLKWYVRVFAGRPQQVCLGLLFLLIVITVWYFRTFGLAGLLKNYKGGGYSEDGAMQASYQAAARSVTFTKSDWSQKLYITGKSFSVISLTPLVKRFVMVNGDPNRVYPLPAGLGNEVNLGNGIDYLQWVIDPNETQDTSVMTYALR